MRIADLNRAVAEESEINIGPLIDIVFILLIFFMVTTTFSRDRDIELSRPQAQSAGLSDTQALRVTVDRAGTVRLDGRRINPWMVQSRLRTALSARTNRNVLVVADQTVATGELVRVVDGCRLAGAAEVAVAVDGKR